MSNLKSYYTQSAAVNLCKITLATGQEYDLKDMLIELSYFEDIYSFCVSGYLMIRDGVGLIELLKLNGTEIITLDFDKYEGNDKIPTKLLVAYTIRDRRPVGNLNGEFYKIQFCSTDLLFNQQKSFSKSYKGKSISYMVNDILENELKCKTPISYIQPTLGVYNYVVPMTKPFETISELSNYARPTNTSTSGTVGADMFLFENRLGYNFVSLNSLMRLPSIATYRYEQSNLHGEDLTHEDDSIIALEYTRSYNTLRDVSSGTYSNKFIGVNYLTGQIKVNEFNYADYLSEIPPQNGKGIQPAVSGNIQLNEVPEGYIKVIPTNSGETNVEYITDKRAVTPDYYLQETLSIRTAQLALIGHTVLKIVVPGNCWLTVGSCIDVLINSIRMSGKQNSRSIDEGYTGKYLITGCRHIIQSSGVYQTVLELSKNSVPTTYSGN